MTPAVLTRLVVATLAGLSVLVLAAAPALAHASLIGETPTDGATIRTPPSKVVLRFDENIRQPSVVVVTGPDGKRVDHGATTVLDNTASVAINVGARGGYTLSYRVVSADGHPVSAQTRFDYQGRPMTSGTAGSGTAGSGTSSSGGPGGTVWVALGALVALLVAAGLLLVGRRRPASDTGEDLDSADQLRSPL
jgi:methionine-rich copper-binding protein CopC